MYLSTLLTFALTSSHLILAYPSPSAPFKASACASPGDVRTSAYNMRIPIDLIAETQASAGEIERRCMRSAMTTAQFDAGCAIMLWGGIKEAERVGIKLGGQVRVEAWVADSKRLCEEWVVGRMRMDEGEGEDDESIRA
jgi:hypothetical protein